MDRDYFGFLVMILEAPSVSMPRVIVNFLCRSIDRHPLQWPSIGAKAPLMAVVGASCLGAFFRYIY